MARSERNCSSWLVSRSNIVVAQLLLLMISDTFNGSPKLSKRSHVLIGQLVDQVGIVKILLIAVQALIQPYRVNSVGTAVDGVIKASIVSLMFAITVTACLDGQIILRPGRSYTFI